MAKWKLDVNGKRRTVEAERDCPLLFVLTDTLALRGPKFGCGLGQCGSCTVLVDGEPVRSCVVPVSAVKGKIVTLEGLGTEEKPHPVQQAFIAEQAAQCGYCISGPLLSGMAYVDRHPEAGEAEIEKALGGLLCRCYAHPRMVRALVRYAREKRA
jgi:nicotinate dehydrogenase subunit A